MDLKESIASFFSANEVDGRIINTGLYVVREDGIPLYNSRGADVQDDIGALASGVWKAAEMMHVRFSEETKTLTDYRFYFDSSDSGIIIYPIHLKDESLLFTAIFSKVTNPGQLKTLLKRLVVDLVDHINNNYSADVKSKKNSDVFNNLSDNEIDRAFALAGFN